MEITKIPPVIEDFEVGDRVYFLNHKHNIIEYGTVTALLDPKVEVTFDIGTTGQIHITQFGHGGSIGKCFPMEQLEVGSVISAFGSGKRSYADVVEIVPDKSVKFKYRPGGVLERTIYSSEQEPLEFKMAHFTLEG